MGKRGLGPDILIEERAALCLKKNIRTRLRSLDWHSTWCLAWLQRSLCAKEIRIWLFPMISSVGSHIPSWGVCAWRHTVSVSQAWELSSDPRISSDFKPSFLGWKGPSSDPKIVLEYDILPRLSAEYSTGQKRFSNMEHFKFELIEFKCN